MIVFAVACGGALGALARFAIGGWVITWAGAGFPWATLLINAAGSLLLGMLNGARTRDSLTPAVRAFMTVGLCGGFTSFSAFDFEMLTLLQERRFSSAAIYSLGSVGLCVAAILAGIRIGGWTRWSGRRERLDA